jgi:hypothetical protein
MLAVLQTDKNYFSSRMESNTLREFSSGIFLAFVFFSTRTNCHSQDMPDFLHETDVFSFSRKRDQPLA